MMHAIGGPGFGSFGYGVHGLFAPHLFGFLFFLAGVLFLFWLFSAGRQHNAIRTAAAGVASVPAPYTAPETLVPRDPAEEIARSRFARGEITGAEYAALLDTLRRS